MQIKMFDGCVRTLFDVQNIPALRRSLLALGESVKKGLN